MLNKLNNILFLTSFWLLILLVKLTYILIIPFILIKKTRKNRRKILFLSPFFQNNAGYQYRAKIWSDILNKNNFQSEVKNSLSEKEFHKLKARKNLNRFHLLFFIRRYLQVVSSLKYDKVIVRRELLLYNDYGNLFLDKLLLFIHPNAILDFDDDIRKSKKEPRSISFYGKLLLENNSKFSNSLTLYNNFICGSNYLNEIVKKSNPTSNSIFIPTCVDYDQYSPKVFKSKEVITFGWIGGNNNQKYLDLIIDDLNKFFINNRCELIVISGTKYINRKANFPIINLKWSIDSQIKDLYKIDIGLMPLKTTPVTKGKCGFKAIQYMGLGIPCIATDLTANKDIIDSGINGFLVGKDNNWVDEFNNCKRLNLK